MVGEETLLRSDPRKDRETTEMRRAGSGGAGGERGRRLLLDGRLDELVLELFNSHGGERGGCDSKVSHRGIVIFRRR